MDTLSHLDKSLDQRRYLDANPCLRLTVQFLRQVWRRSFDAAGNTLVQRVLRVTLMSLGAVEPLSGAPIAYTLVFGAIRSAILTTMLARNVIATIGNDAPILSASAGDSLATLETYDPLFMAVPSTMIRDLETLLIGMSWRAG